MSGNNERIGRYFRVDVTRDHQRLMGRYLPSEEYSQYIMCYRRFTESNILYRLKFRIWMDGKLPSNGFVDCVIQRYNELKHSYESIDVQGHTREQDIKEFNVDGIPVAISYIFEEFDED